MQWLSSTGSDAWFAGRGTSVRNKIAFGLLHKKSKVYPGSLNSAIESIELSSNIESDRPNIISKKKLFSDGNLLNQKGMHNII